MDSNESALVWTGPEPPPKTRWTTGGDVSILFPHLTPFQSSLNSLSSRSTYDFELSTSFMRLEFSFLSDLVSLPAIFEKFKLEF